MKIKGIDLPDNCTLDWSANTIKVSVTLNVSKELVKHMPKNKVFKSTKFWVYWVSKEIPLTHCTPKNIVDTYFHLQKKAMMNLRMYKMIMLNNQILKIGFSQQKLDF